MYIGLCNTPFLVTDYKPQVLVKPQIIVVNAEAAAKTNIYGSLKMKIKHLQLHGAVSCEM